MDFGPNGAYPFLSESGLQGSHGVQSPDQVPPAILLFVGSVYLVFWQK